MTVVASANGKGSRLEQSIVVRQGQLNFVGGKSTCTQVLHGLILLLKVRHIYSSSHSDGVVYSREASSRCAGCHSSPAGF